MHAYWIGLDHVETLTKVLAFSGATAFFAWKVLTGWLITNLSLTIEAVRAPHPSDLVAVKLVLSKGTNDTLYLNQAILRVNDEAAEEGCFYPLNVSRNSTQKQSVSGRYSVLWKADEKRRLSLAPSETMQLSALISIPRSHPALIEAVVVGGRRFWGDYEWRSSVAVSPSP